MPADNALLAAGIGVVFCGVSAYVLAPLLLRSIPEPVLEAGETKVPYAALAGRRASFTVAGCSGYSLGAVRAPTRGPMTAETR